jgi:glycosyltransferase involved in cell wall biosynthesis
MATDGQMAHDDRYLERFSDKTLVLFFTFRVRMSIWYDVGFLEREAALCNRLADYFEQIYILTYGDESDYEYSEYFADNVEIVPQSTIENDHLYSLFLPLIHRDIIAEADILKTNQMKGSWSAVLSKCLFWIPLVVRTGFILSIFAEEQERSRRIQSVFRLIEFISYNTASGVMSPSPEAYEYVEAEYSPRGPHRYVPNYVETDVFRPMDDTTASSNSICFVGRFDEQKNVLSLVEALESTPYSLTLVGDGPLEPEIRERAAELGVNFTFRGSVPNHDIPEILNEHELYVLPSLYEGMPKTLLEAMSCGLPVVGTDVKGTREVIDDGENGILCDTDPDSLNTAITALMEDEQRRHELGADARRTIEAEYSLDSLVQRELDLYLDLL